MKNESSAHVSCENLQGLDLAACKSLEQMVKANDIDLTSTCGAQTAYLYSQLVYQTLAAQ